MSDSIDPLDRLLMEATWPVLAEMMTKLVDMLGGPDAIRAALAEKASWEDAHPGVPYDEDCLCWCTKRGHDRTTCSGMAERVHVVHVAWDEMPVALPVCGACSAALDERTTITRGAQA